MKVAILLNARAGQLVHSDCDHRAREILAACREAGIVATAHLVVASQLTTMARTLATTGVDAIVAAGGDGTVSAVAAGLVGTNLPLGVIPLGTLNHFAKDLGVGDVDSAIKAIAEGRTRRVDVAEVNGKTFINNSSIGLYPEMVVQRDKRRIGSSKFFAMLKASFRVLLRFPLLHVAIALANNVFSARTPFVMVGNNSYALTVKELGSRPQLDSGLLAVYTIRATTRFRMFLAMFMTLFRRAKPVELEAHRVPRTDIVSNKRSLKVALDGEVRRMAPPLTFRSRPGALVVLGGST